MIQDNMLKPVTFEFHGKAGEYFRIWIVNIMLTILTLGIYSAWAKVRNKQYFYGNTLLDESPFEYTASPVAILKGRFVVAAIIGIYYVSVNFFPLSQGLFFILFFLALPWLVMRSLMFNARYSSYRNLYFTFEKNLKDAYKVFVGLVLLIPLTLGLIYPYYFHAVQEYRINNHSFGQYLFKLAPSVKAFYKYYLIGLLIVIVAGVFVAMIFGGMLAVVVGPIDTSPETGPAIPANALTSLTLMAVLYLFAYYLAYAYVQANVFNKVWTNTSLNKASAFRLSAPTVPLMAFKGNLETKKMFWIYLTNTIGIIVSIGLLIPWAKIRLARYRIESLDVSSIADLKVITAKQREQVGTIGSEMGDILDIDIGM